MHASTQPLVLLWRLWHCPAGAPLLLRRVGGWTCDDPHTGPLRLAVQDAEEVAPTDRGSRLRQPRARDALNGKGFVRDHAMLADQLARDVVVEGAPLGGDVPGWLGNLCHHLLAPMAPRLLARDGMLCTS